MTRPTRQRVRPSPTTLVGLLALLVLPLTFAPRAEAGIYWSDPSSATIGSANLDGTGASNCFITGVQAWGLAVDDAHIYWTDRITANPSNGQIGRANLDGSALDESFIEGVGHQEGVAVDGEHIYWTNERFVAGTAVETIGRANLNGTGVDETFISGPGYPSSLAVDAAHIYWTDNVNGTIGRANINGTGVEPNFITGLRPTGVAVDAAHVYWSRWIPGPQITGAIGRANLNGSGADQSFITPTGVPVELAVDGEHIYWLRLTLPMTATSTATIARSNLDGTGVAENFITGVGYPDAIAVNSVSTDGGGDCAKAERTLTLDANKNKVKKKKVVLSGQLESAKQPCESGQAVELQRKKPKQTSFTTFAELQTDAQGFFSARQKLKKTFEFRAQVAETGGCDDALSNTEKVKVKKKK